jgi:hypothetical protein
MRLCVDNSSVVHVTNAFVAPSKPMIRELRRLKKVLDELGLQLFVRVDTIRCKQIRRRTVTSFLT